MAIDVLSKTDYETDTFHMNFEDHLPSGVTLDAAKPTIEFVNPNDGSAATSPPTVVTDSEVRGNGNLTWQFDLQGGTNGQLLIVRVKATRSDGKPTEGNGFLKVGIGKVGDRI